MNLCHNVELVQNYSIEQVVTFSVCLENMLGLFITNRPSLVNRWNSIPGIADHDMVFVESPKRTPRNKPTPRKIHLWKRAYTDQMKKELNTFASLFTTTFDIPSSIEEMLKDITSSLAHILDKYKKRLLLRCIHHFKSDLIKSVLVKMTTILYNQPWI